ncbi:protein DOWNY MILDEW RESISTANCE 6-like [Rosa rugosa]|uniref:protein DOWNY MILDEW RESISTANCE 6-like n=1 Tax=Rosa rugosa TaxID=74645 RepID=UPI002B406C1C|nr:protein DOWNY MILDEW RESISTANCE 6-like [Rosa rugosa]
MFDKMSEKLISNRSDLQFVPESYILPPGTRPGNTQVSVMEVIPVIDFQLLGTNRPQLIKQIIEASQEFGFFQLINHGVEDNLLHKVLDVANEFFEQPYEDKASMYSEDVEQSCRLYTSIDYNKEKVHFWRDNLRHPCHPLEQHIHFWPQKPPQYREVVGSYSVEARKLSILLLDLIGEGLGLESGFFGDELTEVQVMGINYYPPCPDPSLTLGLPKHSDVNLITLLLQGEEVHGLQVLKDGQWLAVEPVPNAFVVNIGHTLQIISNGKLGSAEHRVMTNEKVSRTTVGSFIHPSSNYLVEPAKALLDRDCSSSPLFRAFVYKDFVSTYVTNTHEGVPPLEPHKIQPRSI